MQVQIDLGNLAVGVGTALVALVTYLTFRHTVYDARTSRSIANIKELRREIANFCYVYHQIDEDDLVDNVKNNIRGTKIGSHNDGLIGKLMRSKFNVEMLIDNNVQEHKTLVQYLDKMLEFDKITSIRGLIRIARKAVRSIEK